MYSGGSWNYPKDGTSSLYLTGFQMNPGDTPHPYIKTEGSSVIGTAEVRPSDANSLVAIDRALTLVRDQLAEIGSATNRLRFAANNIASTITANLTSESVIRDADMSELVQRNILEQLRSNVSQAMLAQASSLHRDSIVHLLNGVHIM